MPPTHSIEITGSSVTKRYVSWSRDEPDREWSALAYARSSICPAAAARNPRGTAEAQAERVTSLLKR
jgi:hypothetical protein